MGFEAGGKLYLLGLATEKYHEVQIEVVTDEITIMPKCENVESMIRSYSLSPDDKRAIIEARGELISVPAENGNVVNLTNSSGVAERYPSWSPNGKYVAYWSDRLGEYGIMVFGQPLHCVCKRNGYSAQRYICLRYEREKGLSGYERLLQRH